MNSKQILAAGIGAIIIVIISIFWWLLTPTWVDLYPTDLAADEQLVVAEAIAKLGVDYKQDDATKKIIVQSGDAAKVRKLLAENGVPKKGSAGLEIFANSDYGLSEFVQNINYQRGIEEELARTIRTLNGIKDARVHITMKKPSLFDDRKQDPKASVIVTFKSGYVTDKLQIRGIQEMVATSIAGLQAESVVILTESGAVVSSSGDDAGALDASVMEAKYSKIIGDLLQGYFGDVKFNTAVNIIVDHKKKTTIEENIFPDPATGKGFLVKSKQSDKKDGSGGYDSSSAQQNSRDEEFLYSKARSEISYPSGAISQMSVGIVIQKSISAEEQSILKELVIKSVGMDVTRGDSISLVSAKASSVSLATNPSSEEPVAAAAIESINHQPVSEGWSTQTKLVIFGFGLCLILIILLLGKIKTLSTQKAANISSYERDKIIAELKDWMK